LARLTSAEGAALESTDYLLTGLFAIAFGVAALLLRKHSVRTSRGPRAFLETRGFRVPSERFQEGVQGVGGALFVLAGVGFIIASLVMPN